VREREIEAKRRDKKLIASLHPLEGQENHLLSNHSEDKMKEKKYQYRETAPARERRKTAHSSKKNNSPQLKIAWNISFQQPHQLISLGNTSTIE